MSCAWVIYISNFLAFPQSNRTKQSQLCNPKILARIVSRETSLFIVASFLVICRIKLHFSNLERPLTHPECPFAVQNGLPHMGLIESLLFKHLVSCHWSP